MTRPTKTNCAVDACDRDVEVAGLCKRCYSNMQYWSKKAPGRIVKRQQQLALYSARMKMFTNVSHISSSRKRRRAA